MLNRSVLILRPAEPFLAWARALDSSDLAPDPSGEQTVYLIPEYATDQDAEQFLRVAHRELFERQLDEWHTDETAWPADRSWAAFKEWFDIELHSVVEDLVARELVDDGD